MRIDLKGLHQVRAKLADGSRRTYWYAWRGGPRLSGEPGTPEFIASYNAAVESRKTVPKGRFHSVIAGYKASAEFGKLADRTKADYLKIIAGIEVKFGSMPLSAFSETNKRVTRGIFKKWRDERAAKSERQADYGWSVLGRIISWGVDRGELDTNPAERGGRLYQADRTDKVWTAADEAAFLALAPRHLHLALLLALWTGQRQGDLLKLTWNQYDGRYIRLRQGKTGKRVTIPVGEPLKVALDVARAERRGALVLLTMEGTRWTEDGFRSSWGKACDKAGIAEVSFHDTRGSAITRLALAGASVPEIAAITGHSLRDVQEILDAHYLSRDLGLAESAMAKLEAHQGSSS
ncbi:tyrosine-type recombinase/integrase [Salinarimonas soli]|uniref:Tyrosine-type recombinase/integrase n=1 Tax=Salinarimonas soli TaxID=1638099 RepID=A0A5B2VGP0_9HYPH|nr:tyrosine-type recombinase/integrase [Salinarimonas soli]KAA2237726.1 tyrosine-type recombinase/integrase [Salinarimonas soli]